MPVSSKRRKTGKAGGSRSSSRAPTPVPTSRPESPVGEVSEEEARPKVLKEVGGDEEEEDSTPPLVLTSEKRRGVYECDYCHTDISQVPRIRCAECPDFDLCLDCFATTDHSAAIARLRASVEARTAVDKINAGAAHGQHQGKQAPVGSSSGGSDSAAPSSFTSWQTGSGAINHDDTHGYRVCDNTRYPLFPASRKVVPSRPNSVINDGGGGVGSTRGSSVSGDDEKEKNKEDLDDMDVEEDENLKASMSESKDESGGLSQEVMLVPDDPKAVWTVEEDLRLLEGIRSHGLGNWSEISEMVSGNGSIGKTPKRCMERYFDDFLGRYGHILPPYTLVEDTSEDKGEDGDEDGDDKEETSTNNNNNNNNTTDSNPGTPFKDMDPTRLSKRRHSIMVRTNSSATVQPMSRLSKKMKIVPTESLPEYKKVLEMFPDPKVPVKDPPVQRGQEVGRDLSYKSELLFYKLISQPTISAEEAEKIRKEWEETKFMQPGGPTVLPARPDDVIALPGAELAGFMPRRGDFDIEWENEAEQALGDMEFLPKEAPEDKELKLQVLRIYNERLDERERRKEFILSRNLHDYRKNRERDTKMQREERDLVYRMRMFERFHGPEEHKQFIEGILNATKLRKEIAKLQAYRRMGIRTAAEAEKWENDKSRKLFQKSAHQRDAAAAKESKEKNADAQVASTANAEDASTQQQHLWREYQTDRSDRRRSSTRGLKEAAPAPEATLTEEEKPAAKEDKDSDKNGGPESMDADSEGNKAAEDNENTDENEDGISKTVSSGDFAPEEMEHFHLLSDNEVALLHKIRLTPRQYLDAKNALIHASLKSGMLDKEGSSSRNTLVAIDVEKRGEVVDFCMQAGWLKPKVAARARAISE